MATPRPFALLSTADQWRRAAFQNTALEQNVVQLAWIDPRSTGSAGGVAPAGAGLCFDCECRLYHSAPEQNRVERVRWAAEDPLRPSGVALVAVNLFGAGEVPHFGEFHSSVIPPLYDPRGLAVDTEDRLFLAEHGNRRILIFDPDSKRLLRAVPLAGGPGCLAVSDLSIYAALDAPPGLVRSRLGGDHGPYRFRPALPLRPAWLLAPMARSGFCRRPVRRGRRCSRLIIPAKLSPQRLPRT